MKHRKFLKNAATLTLGGMVAKIIGAAYRIPLANALGGYGMGLYSLAYPLFCLLLSFTSAGVSSALARAVAGERNGGNTLKTALKLFAFVGGAGTLVMCLLAPVFSRMQGEVGLVRCYLALAPSVFLVALISVLRGYFQGKRNMAPTAISNVLEQAVKAAFGLLLVKSLGKTPYLAVEYALLAVTLSECVALFYLLSETRGARKTKTLAQRRGAASSLFAAVFPVMVSASLFPLSQAVDSVLLVRLMANYTSRAVALYGLFSGAALSLINLPVTACSGLAVSAVPAVSASFSGGREGEGRKRAIYAFILTLALALPCAVGLYFFAPQIVKILYPSLSVEDGLTLITLLKTLAPSAVLLGGVETLSACLTGMGKAKRSAISMAIAVLVKFILQWVLVKNPSLSVLGAAIALNACYLIAFSLDLFYTIKKKRVKIYDNDHRTWNGSRRRNRARLANNEGGGQSIAENGVASLGAKPC